jgi:hypothetical protein
MEKFTTNELLLEVLRRVYDAESISRLKEANLHREIPGRCDRTDVYYKTKSGRMTESRTNLFELYERTLDKSK